MRIAYLVSKYPAVSHTFIIREVAALRERGVEVGTFSVRRPTSSDVLGREATAEAARTRWLLWARPGAYGAALVWTLGRPVRLLRTLGKAVGGRGMSLRQRIQGGCYFAEAVLLAYWLAEGGYEHLHCHFGNSGAHTGLLAAELAGVPFSMTCHGSELLEPERHRLGLKVRQAAFVACVSHYGRAQLMRVCPPEAWPRLHVIRCGVPCSDLSRQGTERPAGFAVLCVGRLSPEKGHLILLEALARVRARGCPAECVLVGDGPMRPVIERRVFQLGLEDAVRLVGSRPADRVREMYRSVNLVVLASFSEGVPVVLMEAMAAGCPVVATQVGGVPELIRDRLTGRLVAPGDAEALAEAVQWMLEHPVQARQMARRARRAVEGEFCQSASASRLAALFERANRSVASQTSHIASGNGDSACPLPQPAESC